MTHPETQALIDELASPTHVAPRDVRAFVSSTVPGSRSVGQQAEELLERLDLANAVETDLEVVEVFRGLASDLEALARAGAAMRRAGNQVSTLLRQIAAKRELLEARAASAGYTVPGGEV